MEHILHEIGLDAVQQHRACLADTAANDHALGINDGADVGQKFAHIGIVLIQHLQRQLVALPAGIKNILAGQLLHIAQNGGVTAGFHFQLCHTDNAGGRAILLHAAPLAAAAHRRLVAVEHHVANLRAGTVRAMEQPSFNDNAAADTGSQGDEHHVAAALAAALPEFAQCGHVGIIAGSHGQAGQVGQCLCDVEYAPAQVYAAVDVALAVHGTGDTDADAQQIRLSNALDRPILGDGGCNVWKNLAAAIIGNRGNLPFVKHIARFVKVGNLDGCAAQINTKAVFHWIILLCI